MPCLFAAFEISHRSHSPLCSLFQIPKPTKIQVKIAQLILSPLLTKNRVSIPHPITLLYVSRIPAKMRTAKDGL